MIDIILERLVLSFEFKNIYLALSYAAFLCLNLFFKFDTEKTKFVNYLLNFGSFFIDPRLSLDMYFGYAIYNIVLYIMGTNNKKLAFDNLLHEILVIGITYLAKCTNNFFVGLYMVWTIRDYLITDIILYAYKLWKTKLTMITYILSFIYFRLYSQGLMLFEISNIINTYYPYANSLLYGYAMIFFILLGFLWILQIYWFGIVIIPVFITKFKKI